MFIVWRYHNQQVLITPGQVFIVKLAGRRGFSDLHLVQELIRFDISNPRFSTRSQQQNSLQTLGDCPFQEILTLSYL